MGWNLLFVNDELILVYRNGDFKKAFRRDFPSLSKYPLHALFRLKLEYFIRNSAAY